jgi:GMP synthase (glutamine-hydrolysing)
LTEFDPKKFVKQQTKAINKAVGDARALIAVSGGVDSTTCAVLTHRALKENLLCVTLDTAFMREGGPEKVAHMLSASPELAHESGEGSEAFLIGNAGFA